MNLVRDMGVHSTAFDRVVEQEKVIEQLETSALHPLHAYFFVGPRGSCRWEAAKGFAALILSAGLDQTDADRAVRLALSGEHPDLVRVSPQGNQYRDEEVQIVINEASRTPVESTRKIIVADRFHTANATSVGRLLKTLEEPPPSTIIILMAEDIPDEQITIASRCMTLEFHPISTSGVLTWLLGQNCDGEIAETVALASRGDLHRAADLISDQHVTDRFFMWQSIPERLTKDGYVIAELVEEIRNSLDEAQAVIDERHIQEMELLAEREESLGVRGSGRKELEANQKREIRRFRIDELRFGFATLVNVFRDKIHVAPSEPLARSIEHVRRANGALNRNPNESLLLQGLFISLSDEDI
ncbi:MAG: hypothetical protein VX763_06830 [Actinomycetota bacterium]|nr:hypothetical protein [Actinomycetota bacterium]